MEIKRIVSFYKFCSYSLLMETQAMAYVTNQNSSSFLYLQYDNPHNQIANNPVVEIQSHKIQLNNSKTNIT